MMERLSSCSAAQRALGRTAVPFSRRQPRRCIVASALEGRPNPQPNPQAFLSGLPTMGGVTDPQQQQIQPQQPSGVAQTLSDAAPAAAAATTSAAPAAAGVPVTSSPSPTPPPAEAAEESTPPSWESWCSHFEAQDAAGTQLDGLQEQLQRAVRREAYTTAAELQQQLRDLAESDTVSALRQQLSTALLNEDYATAQAVAEQGATWLEGWWVGRNETAAVGMGGYEGPHPDPLGHLLHVTAEYGRWTGRVYTPRDLAEVSGWVDDSSTQVMVKFGRTAASAMPGPASRRLRPGGPSSPRGPAPSADLPTLQSVGCPIMELFVKEAPASPSSSRDESAGAADTVSSHLQQAVLLQSKQDLKQIAAEAAPRALVQQLARGTDPEAGGRSGRKQRRAGAVTFWFDFGQQGEPGDVQVVEVGMMVQQLGVYKRTVVLPPPQLQQLMDFPERAASPIPFGSDDSDQSTPTATSSNGSTAAAGAEPSSSSSSSSAARDAALADNPSLRHLSSFELREVLDTLQQLKGDSSSSSSTSEEGGWVLAGPSELSSSSSSSPAGTAGTDASNSEEQQVPTPVPRLYGQRSSGDSTASSSDYMNGLARSSDGEGAVLPSGTNSTSSSSSGGEARMGGLAGLFRQAGVGMEEEEGPDGVDLQRLPAGITRLGKDIFVLEEAPAAVPPLGDLTNPLSGIWGSSSSSSGRAPVSPECRYSSVGLGDDPSVPRCVVLTLPVTHAAALAAAKEVSWGSTGILGTTSGTGSTTGRSLEEELAARLGEVEPSAAGGAASSSSSASGEGVLSGSRTSSRQLARELAGERAVWERAARDVVARQVELTGRPLPPQCVSQMAGVLQLHAETLAAAGLVVSPGAPVEVTDCPADYTPEPARMTYQRLPVNQPRTDPFTGLYLGAFGPHGQELLQLQRQVDEDGDEEVVGIKLTGDVNVPAGVVSFRAKVGRRHRLSLKDGGYPEELGVTARYPGQGRVAQSGFRSPQWVDGELVVFSSRSAASWVIGDAPLGFLWAVPGERRYLILLHRIHLDDLQ